MTGKEACGSGYEVYRRDHLEFGDVFCLERMTYSAVAELARKLWRSSIAASTPDEVHKDVPSSRQSKEER
ncbi:MAG: hypothetical protein SGPRY_009270 [Prymnesium sp.]